MARRIDVGSVDAQPVSESRTGRLPSRREFAALGAGSSVEARGYSSSAAPSNPVPGGPPTSSQTSDRPTSPDSLPRHPAIRTDEDQDIADLSAPADKRSWDSELLAPGMPPGLKEANHTYDSEGSEAFQIWHPPQAVSADADDGDAADGEEYR